MDRLLCLDACGIVKRGDGNGDTLKDKDRSPAGSPRRPSAPGAGGAAWDQRAAHAVRAVFLSASARRLLPSRREVRPTMALEYRERSTLGTGWALEVCSSGELVGHIQFGAQNLFRYYPRRRE